VVYQARHTRWNPFAGIQAETRCAGIDDATHAIRAAIVVNRMAFTRARSTADKGSCDFFSDDFL
jgi:hypothetical protein